MAYLRRREAETLREKVMAAVVKAGEVGTGPEEVAQHLRADLEVVTYYLRVAAHRGWVRPCHRKAAWPARITFKGSVEFGDLK